MPRKSKFLKPGYVRAEIKGLNELLDGLSQLDDSMAVNVLDRAVFEAASQVAEPHIRAVTPFATGKLAGSITTKKLRPRQREGGAVSVASMIGPESAGGKQTSAFYGLFLETGTEERYTGAKAKVFRGGGFKQSASADREAVTWPTPQGEFRTTSYRGAINFGQDKFLRRGLFSAAGSVVAHIRAAVKKALAGNKKFGGKSRGPR